MITKKKKKMLIWVISEIHEVGTNNQYFNITEQN